MATNKPGASEGAQTDQDADSTLLDTQSAAVKRLIARGKERGYITFDELNAILPPDQMSSEQIEDMMAMLSEMGINVVESEEGEEGEAAPKPEKAESEEGAEPTEGTAGNVDEESLGRTDDPVRMYLREMGSVELLSREGEIAIAKRIEAGRDMMIGGLCESPLTFRAIIAWHDALKGGRMLLRDIIDLEATQGAGAPPPAEVGEGAPDGASDNFEAETQEEIEEGDEGEGAGLSLSALEEKLKPEVFATFEEIETLYKKLRKVQARRLEHYTSGDEISARSEKSYEKQREELVGHVQQVRLHNNRIEELVTQLKQLNQRLNACEGQLLRMAESSKVARDDFLARYREHELDPNWFDAMAQLPGKGWKAFATKHAVQIIDLRTSIGAVANDAGLPDRRVPPRLCHGQPRRARQCACQEGDDRGQPAARDLDRQEVHQPRAAVPGPDPGGQHRPDEGRGQVRVPPRLQVQHLCDLVDPAGDHAQHRRPGAHHTHPRAHDRDDQQAGAHLAPDAARDRPRAGTGGAGREAGHAAREGAQGAQDRQGADQPGDADRRRGGQPPRRLHRGQGRRHPARRRDPGQPARGDHAGAVLASRRARSGCCACASASA